MGSVDFQTEKSVSSAHTVVEPTDVPEPPKKASERAWRSDHPINIRLSLPFFFDRYYVTLVAGRERRNVIRRAEERRKHPLVTVGNVFVFVVLGVIAGLAALALIQIGSVLWLESTGFLSTPE